MTGDNQLDLATETDRLEREAEKVARRMREDGVWVTYDLRVNSKTTAYMLGITEATLRNRRYMEMPPMPVKTFGSRDATYRLVDILLTMQMDKAA
jgi:hypothetical protein